MRTQRTHFNVTGLSLYPPTALVLYLVLIQCSRDNITVVLGRLYYLRRVLLMRAKIDTIPTAVLK